MRRLSQLRNNGNVVLNLCDAGRRPRYCSCVILLRPGTDISTELHRAVVTQDNNAPRIQIRTTPERFFDFGPHVTGWNRGANDNPVGDQFHTGQIPDGRLRGVALEVPVHIAFQQNLAVFHRDLDACIGHCEIALQRLRCFMSELRIGCNDSRLNFQVIYNVFDTVRVWRLFRRQASRYSRARNH